MNVTTREFERFHKYGKLMAHMTAPIPAQLIVARNGHQHFCRTDELAASDSSGQS